MSSDALSLLAICARNSVIKYFKMFGSKAIVVDTIAAEMKLPELPSNISDVMNNTFEELEAEITRWDRKHQTVLVDTTQFDLDYFHDKLIWRQELLEIDDFETARFIIALEQPKDIKFKFAALYAMEDIVNGLIPFIQREDLNNHPIYTYWFYYCGHLLPNGDVETSNIATRSQLLEDCFAFSIQHDYLEMIELSLKHMDTDDRTERLQSQWHRLCGEAREGKVLRFLSEKFMNCPNVNLLKLSWNTIWDGIGANGCEKLKLVEFLLENVCPELRSRILSKMNYELFIIAFQIRDRELMAMLVRYTNEEELEGARNAITGKIERNKSRSRNQMLKIDMCDILNKRS